MDKYVLVIALSVLALCANADRRFYYNNNLVPYYYNQRNLYDHQRNYVPTYYYPQPQRAVYNNKPVQYSPYQQYYRRHRVAYKYDTDYGTDYHTD